MDLSRESLFSETRKITTCTARSLIHVSRAATSLMTGHTIWPVDCTARTAYAEKMLGINLFDLYPTPRPATLRWCPPPAVTRDAGQARQGRARKRRHGVNPSPRYERAAERRDRQIRGTFPDNDCVAHLPTCDVARVGLVLWSRAVTHTHLESSNCRRNCGRRVVS